MNAAPLVTPPIRVLCVDDRLDMTAALKLIIENDSSMVCLGCLSTAKNLLQEVSRHRPPPDVLILDASIPGENPLAAMKDLADRCPEIRTIIYSGHDDGEFVERAIKAGAWRCVSKIAEPAALLQAVREVAAGRSPDRPR